MTLRNFLAPVLLLLVQVYPVRSGAQLPDYHVQIFDERDGVRTDVERLITDNRGFVWLAYSDRIQRYDGKKMEEFFLEDRINSIATDSLSRVWVTTASKVYLYEKDKKSFGPVAVLPSANIIHSQVIQLPGREMWLLTNNGFFAFDPKQFVFAPVTDKKAIAKTPVNIRRFCASHFNNTIFYSSKDTIWSLDVSTGQMRHLPVESLQALHALNETQALVSTWENQSFLYDLQAQTIQPIHPTHYLQGLVDDFLVINAVVSLGASRYLLATSKGILEYTASNGVLAQKQFYYKGQPLPNGGRSRYLHVDQHKKVWSCSENNLMVFDPYNEAIGLIRNTQAQNTHGFNSNVRNFAADEKGNLWLATNNGITYWDLSRNTQTSIFPVEGATDRMNHPSVRGIAYDGKHVIIGQSNRGIWLYNPVTTKYQAPLYEPGPNGVETKKKLEQDFIDQIYTLHNGNHIVAARDGAYLIDKESYLVRQVHFPGSAENLNFSYEDNLKQIWIGTRNSIHCLDSNLLFLFSISEGIGSGITRCLLQWNDHEYILGAKGLYMLTRTGETITAANLNHFFDKINIHSLFRDRSDHLWVGTDQGLYRYTKATGQVEGFDYFDNIQGDFFNGNSLYYGHSDGMLFLGGLNGINYFHPDKIKSRQDSLQVALVRVSVNQDDTSFYNRASLLSLQPNQNSIEIEFIAPYFGNTNRVQYRYRLDGLTDAWQLIGQTNRVRFTSLRPGTYTFNVAASINGMHWYESDEKLQFAIAVPFWKRWWFIALVMLVLTGSALYLFKQRIRNIRQQAAVRSERAVQLITMNRDLATSQLTALRAQMNPHFIFNALNSVQRYILKGDVDQANKYLSKFSRLQREVLNNSSQDFISLEKEIEILELYLQLEQLRFDEKFTYSLQADKLLDTSEIKIPPMILQPFVENAIWHGLMPRQGAKTVAIQFYLHSDELLHCRILDNGIGRAAAARLKNNHEGSALHESKGLSLVNERLRILEQLYQHSYQVEVIDKLDPTGAVTGTEVNLTFHIGR